MADSDSPGGVAPKGRGLTTQERRYSDGEFAAILLKASELPEGPKARAPVSPRGGLTLPEIQEIASEVGIDPSRVARAAALLPVEEASTFLRLVGGTPRYHMDTAVRGLVPTEDLGKIIEVARQKARIPGETREVMGGLEWTGTTGTTGYGASVTPHEGQTRLQVWTNRGETMAGIYGGVGMGVLAITGLTMVKLVFGESDAGIVASLFSGIPLAFLTARTIWKRSSTRFREQMHDLLEAMRKEAEAVAKEPEA